MSNRFSVLDTNRFSTYNEELPVIVVGSNLLQDSLSGRLFAQLKLQSISTKQITAIRITVESLDAQERPIESCDYVYNNLHLYRDNTIGEDVLIPLEDNRGRKIKVYVRSIVDSGGMESSSNNNDIKSLWTLGDLSSSFDGDKEMVKQYQLTYGNAHTFAPSKPPGLWTCSCGAINTENEDICHNCGFQKEDILNPNYEELKEQKELRLINEKIEKDAKRSKAIRTSVIVGTITAAIAIVSFVFFKIIVPETNYRDALKAYKAGNYNEAYASFSSLSDYKKSAEYARISKKAFIEKSYKEILTGSNAGSMEEYYTIDEIKSKNTQFCLAFIDYDEIPELVVKIDGDLFFYSISDGQYLDTPYLCRAYGTYGTDDYGFYEETGYIHSYYSAEDEAYYEWIPMREDSYQDSYKIDVSYYSFYGDNYDYYIVNGDGEERYVYEEEFYQALNMAISNKEMTPFKMHGNDQKNRDKFIVI